jgi:LacI family transcriptional regulator
MSKMWKVMLIFDTSGASSRRTLRGIAKYSSLYGPWVFLREQPFYMATIGNLRCISRKLPHPQKKQVDGIIAHIPYPQKGCQIIPSDIPSVVSPYAQEQFPNFYNLLTDDTKIGIMAAEYFFERNFRNFAYCGYHGMSWSKKRGDAFKKYLIEKGFQVDIYEGCHTKRLKDPNDINENTELSAWLTSLPKPLALMACNDDRAQDLTQACKTSNLRIPHDVAILGVDNDDLLCDFTDPPISSIAVNNEQGGYEAAQLLEELMMGKKPKVKNIICCPTHVVTRQSTDAFAIDDAEIVSAIRFINEHANENIRVDDVAKASLISRRVLEYRFKKIVGRSILSEIRRVRTDNIARLLLETDISIVDIAKKLNFMGIEHIARYFKQAKNMSLREFRKKYV